MRNARRLIASAILVSAALFIGAGSASADSVWQLKNRPTVVTAEQDSVWE